MGMDIPSEPVALAQRLVSYSREPDWLFGMSGEFTKNIHNLDRKIKGSILEAVKRICDAPMRPHGNTIKQLNESKKGLWRYRIGDFRLIYFPDQKEKMVILMAFLQKPEIIYMSE